MTLVAFPPLPTRLTNSSSSSSSSTAPSHQNQPHSGAAYELDQLRPPPPPPPPPPTTETASRSRASSLVSSLVSTGTRFSITTLPQAPLRTIDSAIRAEDGRANGMGDGVGNIYDNTIAMTATTNGVAATRPASLYSYSDSVRSTSTSLPPYEPESDMSHGAAFARGLSVPGETAENLISRHYGNVVRTIDANHQRLLARTVQGHERELAQMRDAMDKVYRREFVAREREVERVREVAAAGIEEAGRKGARRIEALEREVGVLRAEMEEEGKRVEEIVGEMSRGFAGGVERACYVVEEVWERRWGDRLRVEGEEGERRVRRRDEEWVAVLEKERVGLGEEMRRAMGARKEESG